MPNNDKPAENATQNRSGRMLPGRFQLVLVEKAAAPDGAAGQTWYRYVLDNGSSQITGQRCGGLKEVTAYATDYAEQLNVRSVSGHSTWAPRGRKPASSSSSSS